MIPLTFLYDEYIDRPKLTEQKNPFEYIVPSLTSGVGTTTGNKISNGGLNVTCQLSYNGMTRLCKLFFA